MSESTSASTGCSTARRSPRAWPQDGISYTEFSYQLLQSYDFVQLYRRFGCTLQTGGSDQWGNIVAGVDLIRRMDGGSAHALTTPLMTKSDGTKFGKTESGTVWLDPELTSPYAFFQFWLNSDDRDVASLLHTFSFRSQEEIGALLAAVAERPQAREAQRALASELTAMVHGEAERDAAEAAGRALFGQGDLADLPAATLSAALAEAPNVEIPGGGDHRRPAAVVRRAVRAHRTGGQQVGGPAHDRRGRRLREQRPGHRCGGPAGRE